MQSILNWISAARWRKSLSHCFEAIGPYVVASLAFWNVWCGVATVIGWAYSREVIQSQMKAKQPGASTVTVWYVGYLPWQWDFWSMMDVLFPVVSSVLLTVILKLW
jgi:hypothetical protein